MVAKECAVSVVQRIAHISSCAAHIFHINADPCHCDCLSSLLHTNANCYGENKQRCILQSNFFLSHSQSPDVIEAKNQHTLHFQCFFTANYYAFEMHILIVEYLSRQNGRLFSGLFSIFNSCEWRIVPKC